MALVTGGASGIGRAVCEALTQRGARVVVADVDGERAREAARDMGAEAEQLDVVDAAAVESLFERVWRAHRGIDFVFNNAGICIIGNARDFEVGDYHRLIDVNIRGVVNGTHAAYRRMAERGSGHIVNTASIAGLVPSPRFTGYAMTKHAVVGLSTSLRIEAAKYGVRVSAVCPGVIDTPMAQNALMRGAIDRDAAIHRIPMYAPERCAADILAGVEKNRALIVVTPYAKAAFAMHRFAPEWLPKLMLAGMRRFER